MALSKQAKRGLLVALGYRQAEADEFEKALFNKQNISKILKLNIIDAMARKDEANEVIACLEHCGHTLSAKALRRFKVMIAGVGNLDGRAALAEILPLLQAPCPIIITGMELLAYAGITNVGSTVVTGDIGVFHTDAISGFPPGLVSGVIHHVDAAAIAAAAAQLILFNSYQTLGLAGSTIPSALDGQTLTPGHYKFASGAATLAQSGPGTLTLNGAGQYIIYTASTLGTGAGGLPTIALTGGATAANVFWIVGSSATINIGVSAALGVFQGNIIASASITNSQGGTMHGQYTALNGAISLSAATIVEP